MPARPSGNDGGRTALLVAVGLSAFLAPFLGSSLNLAIPAIGRDLHASAVTLNWVVTAYLVASAACLLPFGRLADLVGRRRIFLLGTLAQTTFLLAAAFAPSVSWLVALRLLQGAAGAMAFATSMALLVAAFPAAERGRVLGIGTAAVYVGLSLGPPLGGFITQQLGWRAVFLVNAAIGALLAAVLSRSGAKESEARTDERFDLGGAALYAFGLAALIGGLSTVKTIPPARWAIVAGALALTAFVVRDLAAAQPILALRLFRGAVFAFSNLAALLNYAATFAVGYLLSLYLQGVRGLSAREAGLVLLAQPVVMALLSPAAGRLSDRLEPRRVASLGMALSAAGLALFVGLGETTPLAWVVAGLLLLGTGFGLFSSPNSNAVMSAVGARDYGVASATLGTMRLLGQAFSMAAAAAITAARLGGARLGEAPVAALLGAQRAAFVLFALLCAAGIAASLARGRVRTAAG
ncbi:MAG: MFS transporter [Holophagales bacterium]|nr:MAG: MFS transporter [Holophagales bacterium]